MCLKSKIIRKKYLLAAGVTNLLQSVNKIVGFYFISSDTVVFINYSHDRSKYQSNCNNSKKVSTKKCSYPDSDVKINCYINVWGLIIIFVSKSSQFYLKNRFMSKLRSESFDETPLLESTTYHSVPDNLIGLSQETIGNISSVSDSEATDSETTIGKDFFEEVPKITSSRIEKKKRKRKDRSATSRDSTKPTQKKIKEIDMTEKEETVKIFITSHSHPSAPLNKFHFEVIMDYVSDSRSNATLEDENIMHLLKIHDIDIDEMGIVCILCDEFTKKWLGSLDFKLEEKGVPTLRASDSIEEANRMGRCSILVKNRTKKYTEEDFLRQLNQGNKDRGFVINKILLWDRKLLPKDPKHMVLNFSVDYDFIEWMKVNGNTFYFDLKKTQIFYPGLKKNGGEKRQKLDEI